MLDFALNGDGFFTVMSADGQTMLTRDGKFTVDQNGFLTDLNGNFIMGQNGQINVGNADFTVDEQGNIFLYGTVSDSFLITVPDNKDGLNMLSNGLLSFNGGAGVYTGKVLQGSLEKSNINLVDEMTAMMKDSRAFQTCSQIVKAEDELMKKTVSEIARL
jgi:flagellar basal-body rod protein FlgG